jgi:hypothetical protein
MTENSASVRLPLLAEIEVDLFGKKPLLATLYHRQHKENLGKKPVTLRKVTGK